MPVPDEMCIRDRPMITAGRYDVVWEDDGWTVVTEDGSQMCIRDRLKCQIMALSEAWSQQCGI